MAKVKILYKITVRTGRYIERFTETTLKKANEVLHWAEEKPDTEVLEFWKEEEGKPAVNLLDDVEAVDEVLEEIQLF